MSAEELRINFAEIEALHKLPISLLTKKATPTPIMPLKLDHQVAADLMKGLKKRQKGTLTEKDKELKFNFSTTKPLMIDLLKPQKYILPKSKPDDYATVATCSLEFRRHIESSPELTIKHNQIF